MPELAYNPDPRPTPLQFPASRGFGSIRERVLTARTYYVAPSGGSDTFNGLSLSAAFATLAKAVEVVHQLDIANNVTVTIQLMDGTHTISSQVTLRNFSGIGSVTIQGNTQDASAVTLRATTNSIQILAFIGASQARWIVQHLTFQGQSANTAVSLDGMSRVNLGNARFTSGFTQAINCSNGSFLTMFGSAYEFTAAMTQAILCQRNSLVLATATGTWTISNTPAITAFVSAIDAAAVRISSAAVTFSGSATGNRYSATGLSLIQTNGGGPNFFPGNNAGSSDASSVYA